MSLPENVSAYVDQLREEAKAARKEANEYRRAKVTGSGGVAEQIARQADDAEAHAQLADEVANAEEKLGQAKAAFHADPSSDRSEYDAAAAEVRELRAYWRGLGELAGKRTGVAVTGG